MGRYLDLIRDTEYEINEKRQRQEEAPIGIAQHEINEKRRSKGHEQPNRFGQPHAALFPLLGRKVRTPSGPGTLIQVFADRAAVLLDSDVQKCAVFHPEEVRAI